jgi:hypothetical protein
MAEVWRPPRRPDHNRVDPANLDLDLGWDYTFGG